MFDPLNQQNGFNVPTANQQDASLLGVQPSNDPVASQQMFNPDALNTTAFQNNPAVANMIKALKGTS